MQVHLTKCRANGKCIFMSKVDLTALRNAAGRGLPHYAALVYVVLADYDKAEPRHTWRGGERWGRLIGPRTP